MRALFGLALLLVAGCTAPVEAADETTSAVVAAPFGELSRRAYCEALAACDASADVEACVGDAWPEMTAAHFARCRGLAEAITCDQPRDTGAWVSTRFACGL